ncbi:MAG TPA: hypothetical protein VLB50_06910 [Ignavibacteriaceae bacterium]|nr:hypothetical protein [Ignavibacteriaceae bacterium]
MKNLLVVLMVVFVSFQLSAQELLTQHENRFYADLVSKAAALNGSWGLLGGMRAGYNIDKNISVGAAAHGLIPNKLGGSYINQDNRDELHLGYGGAEVSYNYDLSDKFYLTGNMMIGAGRIDYEKMDGNDYFFVMEPGASVNYRITDYFGLGYSLNYRLASGVKYADFSNASFSGWSTELTFNFGF